MDYRKRLFEVIEIAEEDDKVSNIYDALMMISIIAIIVPMAFKTTNMVFEIVDKSLLVFLSLIIFLEY